ncbi:MAG: class I SAM-dependent methyltransferase [Desulfatitalea sp.]|nr:class I SAM-dependent methyltransferase [Desulfatitalea sp.]
MEANLDMPLGQVLTLMQAGIMKKCTYFGVKTYKSPIDAWIYQEIIFETQPDVIVEIGNANGGSGLLLAHLCDLMDRGRVICLDIDQRKIHKKTKNHPRITLIEGDACANFAKVEKMIAKDARVLVIEDSAHTFENTLNVLRRYCKLIKPGDYFIVEDSICHHGLDAGPNPGPYEAIESFVTENTEFEIDRSRERYFITWNPKGYLKRKGPPRPE